MSHRWPSGKQFRPLISELAISRPLSSSVLPRDVHIPLYSLLWSTFTVTAIPIINGLETVVWVNWIFILCEALTNSEYSDLWQWLCNQLSDAGIGCLASIDVIWWISQFLWVVMARRYIESLCRQLWMFPESLSQRISNRKASVTI